ncbi:hypothetical protein [Kitasatospora sp. NPDC015120]|uniref:hypothetical protein n=1 Tax=Kitasatospora sp. NPDC015120 TaxID=3364023 RepID=UPI0036F4A008
MDDFPDNDTFSIGRPSPFDDGSPEEIWQRLFDMAEFFIRFGLEADVTELGVTDQEAWAGAIRRLGAAMNGGPGPDLPQVVNASRELVALVTASLHDAFERGGINAAVAVIRDSLVALDARRVSPGE